MKKMLALRASAPAVGGYGCRRKGKGNSIMIGKVTDPRKVEALFDNWQEAVIWSCLQQVMGALYADSEENPRSAMAILGDFCYLAGEPNPELAAFSPYGKEPNYIIMVPQNPAWGETIETVWKGRAKKGTRYAIKKEPGIFDLQKLQEMADALSLEYTLQMIDEELYREIGKREWCRDWIAQYETYEKFAANALGAVVLKGREPVSGASTYCHFQGGIEIQIDTRKDCRRQGLAGVCAAKLILECEKRGLYPSWDARTRISVKLAEKLGYHYWREYDAYEICGCGGGPDEE